MSDKKPHDQGSSDAPTDPQCDDCCIFKSEAESSDILAMCVPNDGGKHSWERPKAAQVAAKLHQHFMRSGQMAGQRMNEAPKPLPAAFPIGAIRELSNGALGVVEEDEQTKERYVRWGTCVDCPVGKRDKRKTPWQCDNYERHDHRLRSPIDGHPPQRTTEPTVTTGRLLCDKQRTIGCEYPAGHAGDCGHGRVSWSRVDYAVRSAEAPDLAEAFDEMGLAIAHLEATTGVGDDRWNRGYGCAARDCLREVAKMRERVLPQRADYPLPNETDVASLARYAREIADVPGLAQDVLTQRAHQYLIAAYRRGCESAARSEIPRLTGDGFVDFMNGEASAQREIAAWLRRYADEHSGSHPAANSGHIACNAAANAIERGEWRPVPTGGTDP